MIFTNATEYAIRGIAELAGRTSGGNMLLDQLVSGTDLPRDFMAKIFQKLVRGPVALAIGLSRLVVGVLRTGSPGR